MARRDPSIRKRNDPNSPNSLARGRIVDFDIYQELARLQEFIYESFHLPLTRWTVIDEGKLLDQLEIISESVPGTINRALAVVEKEQEILAEAQDYAQQILQSAQQRAAQILDETGIVQQAERQASQIRQQVHQECEVIQQTTLSEIDQMREMAAIELERMRQQALMDAEDIQGGADDYADAILTHLEQNLNDMLNVVRNGRQQVQRDDLPPSSGNKLPNK